MKHDAQGWVSVRYWQPPAWDWGFSIKCLLMRLAVTMGPAGVLMSLRQGVAALVVFVALSAWPWAWRVRVSDDGLELRQLFVSAVLPLAELEQPSLEPDP